jgi:hypothetical protein
VGVGSVVTGGVVSGGGVSMVFFPQPAKSPAVAIAKITAPCILDMDRDLLNKKSAGRI